jgi:hypothetical protein
LGEGRRYGIGYLLGNNGARKIFILERNVYWGGIFISVIIPGFGLQFWRRTDWS